MRDHVNIINFVRQFPDEDTCEMWIMKMRWPNGITCPCCCKSRIYRLENQKRFKCAYCKKQFTVRTGSLLADSKVPLHKWLMTVWILTSSTKGVSVIKLANTLGVTQKTAHYLMHRVKGAFSANQTHSPNSDCLPIKTY